MPSTNNLLNRGLEYLDENLQQMSQWQPLSCPTLPEKWLLTSAIIEASDQVQVDPSMATFAALAAISSACQGLIDIELPPGHTAPASLMVLVIAESGERKTSLEKLFFNSIRRKQSDLHEQFLTKLDQFDIDKREHAEKVRVAKQLLNMATKERLRDPDATPLPENDEEEDDKQEEGQSQAEEDTSQEEKGQDNQSPASPPAKSKESPKDKEARLAKCYREFLKATPTKPKEPKFLYEDVTPAALLNGIAAHNKNASLVSTEANKFFRGHVVNDLSTLNAFWDGQEMPVDRASSESFKITNARLTLLLMAQGVTLDQFMDKRGEEARGIGFFARLLVAKPQSMAGYRRPTQKKDRPSLAAFNDRLSKCLDDQYEAEMDNQARQVMRFNAQAAALWEELAEGIERQMAPGGIFEFHPDYGSKLMDNISRIAGLIHYFEHFNSRDETCRLTISKKSLMAAYELGEYCSTHYLKYLAGVPGVVLVAEDLVNQITDFHKKNQNKFSNAPQEYNVEGLRIRAGFQTYFNRSDVTRSGTKTLRDEEPFRRALFLLVQLGHVKTNQERDPLSAGKPYLFCEAIIHTNENNMPALRNGHTIEVRNLPRFGQQVFKNPHLKGHEEHPDYVGLRSGRQYYIKIDEYDQS